MKKIKAGDTIKELCPKCGEPIGACPCAQLAKSAEWPMSGNRPRSEGEMSDTFSKLKEAGIGTMFLRASSAQDSTAGTSIDLAADAIIGGVYKIIRLIGSGGMGEVYLARHLTLGKKCALKVIPPDQVTEASWQRFQLEAKTVAQLEHVNIVRVTDLGIHEGCLPFYAMEYLDGKNLAEMLSEQGPMSLDKALGIFSQVCDGVGYAHREGILHRDLKPANIMLTQATTGKLEVKILDFGLAKLTKHNRFRQSLTAVGDVFGSPYYMSPEQCGSGETDNRSDIYSIGCTLFECLTGRPPFFGHLAAAVFFGHLESEPPTLEHAVGSKKLPQSMEAVMAKLLRKDPDQRYQTLSELKADLELVADGKDLAPAVVSQGDKAFAQKGPDSREPAGQDRSRVPLLLCVVTAVLISIGGLAYFQFSAQREAKPQTARQSTLKLKRIQVSPEPAVLGGALVNAGVASTGGVIGPGAEVAELDPQTTGQNEKWDGAPFYQGIVVRHGKKYQHWSYHCNSAAPLYVKTDGPKGWQKYPLTGDLYILQSARVCLYPRRPLINRPELLKGLVGANCDEVDYYLYSWTDVQAVNPTFAQCQSIKAVGMGNFTWSIENAAASVDAINQFASLERLYLFAQYEGSTLAKIHRLKGLKELTLNLKQPYTRDCLKAISGSTNLLSFTASSWSSPARDLELFAQCPNLEKLKIGQLTGSHEQFVLLAKQPHLQQLDMPALRYRSDLAADLSLLKSLKTLKVLSGGDLTAGQVFWLRHDLPHIELVQYAQSLD
jgi:serine/threonine-protein kinase